MNTKMMSKEQRIMAVLDEMERHGYWADAACAQSAWSGGRPYYTTNIKEHVLFIDLQDINSMVIVDACSPS